MLEWFRSWRLLGNASLPVSLPGGVEHLEAWSDGLVAIRDGDAVVRSQADLIVLLVDVGMDTSQAQRSAGELWPELEMLRERWKARAGSAGRR